MCSSLYKQRLSRKWIHTYTYVYVVNGILKQVGKTLGCLSPTFFLFFFYFSLFRMKLFLHLCSAKIIALKNLILLSVLCNFSYFIYFFMKYTHFDIFTS